MGGFVGYNQTNGLVESGIVTIQSNLNISGLNELGGFVGRNDQTIQTSSLNVESLLSIYGASYVGGFGGYNTSLINGINVTTTSIKIDVNHDGNNSHTGGFVGFNTSNVENVSFISTETLLINANGRRVGGFIGTIDAGSVNIIHFETSGIVINQTEVMDPGATGGFIGSLGGNSQLKNVNSTSNSINITSSSSFIGGFVGYILNANIENTQQIISSSINLSVAKNSVGYFAGGSPTIANPIFSGIVLVFDASMSSLTGATSGNFFGRIEVSNANLEFNNVFYTSGTTSSDTLVKVNTTSDGSNTFDGIESQSGLSEVTSGVLLSIINSDDVFELPVAGNQFPVLKDTANQTIILDRQRLIDISWLA
jgi:hypothetical protein